MRVWEEEGVTHEEEGRGLYRMGVYKMRVGKEGRVHHKGEERGVYRMRVCVCVE